MEASRATALPAAVDLTDAERTTYERAIPVINKVAAAVVRGMVAPVMQQLDQVQRAVASLQQATSATAARTDQSAKMAFEQALMRAEPGARATMSEQGFRPFLQTQAPFGVGSYGSLLSTALQRFDVASVGQILSAYRARTAASPVNNLAPHAAPAGAGAGLPPPPPSDRLKWSDRQTAWANLRAGKITQTEFDTIAGEFTRATAEGRVDMNA